MTMPKFSTFVAAPVPLSKVRSPNYKGPGRKPLAVSGEVMSGRNVRMTDSEWEKCKRLGGGAWIREKIRQTSE